MIQSFPEDLLYRRSHVIGRIEGDRGARRFVQVEVDGMRLIIDEHVRLSSWVLRPRAVVPVEVYRPSSRDHGGLIIAAASSSPAIRALVQIVRFPQYLPDRTLARPGWNTCGIFYDEPAALAEIEPITDPDRIHAVLSDLVVDFPFRSAADRANAIGLLLTAVVRPAIDGNFPMHVVTAPLERTGKTKLASECMGGVLLGRPMAVTQLAGKEEEIEKRILAALLADLGFLLLDNVGTAIDSPSIASLLTSREFTGRLLSKSLMLTLPNNMLLVSTGNNVSASGEIAKRSIPICLQPATDEPERRADFVHADLPTYVGTVRRDVLGALIGAVSLWNNAGRPKHPSRSSLGGFESWSAVVGGILALIGFQEWRANEVAWHRAADPRGADLEALVAAWWATYGSSPQSAKGIADLARKRGLFPDCFARPSEHGAMQAFVKKALTRNVDRPVGAYRVRRESYGSSAQFFLETQA